MMRFRFPMALLAALLIAMPAMAQNSDRRVETVRFPSGASGTMITDRIQGYQYVDYRLGANAGQWMRVELDTDNLQNYFNILAPGETDVAFHIGSTQGNLFEGVLPDNGTYTIRVYMMRAAARRDEVADYRLSVSITGRQQARPPERPPEGGAGGPDFFRVANLPAGDTLNLREGPGTRFVVVVELAPNTLVRNLGCQGSWCRVEDPAGSWSGWAFARYLAESAGAAQLPFQPGDALVPGTSFHATGPIDCRFGGDASVTTCQFGVVRMGGGDARLEITFPDGFKRTLFFQGGEWSSPQTGEVTAARFGDETEVIADGTERFTIPDAVMFGG